MPAIHEPNALGDLLKYEAPNLYSRDRVTVAAGEDLELGAVVGRITATGRIKRLDAAAGDGSQTPVGVLLQAVDATLIERDALMVARHATVADAALVWPAGITPAEKDAAVAALESLGVLVRPSA